jgi:NAD(P)H-hydrate epimerase
VAQVVDGGYRGQDSVVVMTPHPGELAIMTGGSLDDVLARPYELLDHMAEHYRPLGRVVTVLKGSASILRDDHGEFYVVDGRCPVLGTAGSGDVLSGIVGAYLAGFRAEPAEVVLAGVGEHLRRGRLLERHHSFVSATTLAVTSGGAGTEPDPGPPGEERER